jgi:hypothetical protein
MKSFLECARDSRYVRREFGGLIHGGDSFGEVGLAGQQNPDHEGVLVAYRLQELCAQ